MSIFLLFAWIVSYCFEMENCVDVFGIPLNEKRFPVDKDRMYSFWCMIFPTLRELVMPRLLIGRLQARWDNSIKQPFSEIIDNCPYLKPMCFPRLV